MFLPFTLSGYYFFGKQKNSKWANAWLVFLSLFFYSYWNVKYLPLLVGSILVNYFCAGYIIKYRKISKIVLSDKLFFVLGLFFNISLLSFFKYTDFFLENINTLAGSAIPLMHIILPLGISFFTITQIVYLVDCYDGVAKDHDFLNYSLFVSFFPHLLAGPILYHKPMMKQFSDEMNCRINWENMVLGLKLFVIGLGKKVLLADSFGVYAQSGFLHVGQLTFFDGWLTALCYMLQLYFDFSGYSDMAVGIAWMLNIKIPINFNSPYKANNLINFWSRWHISLTNTITNYLYTPILMSFKKIGFFQAMFAIFIAMFIAGIWHGAGWTFVVFAIMHAGGLVINHAWKHYKWPMPKILSRGITLLWVMITLVIFRANTLGDAWQILQALIGMHGLVITNKMMQILSLFPATTGTLVFPIGPACVWAVCGFFITMQLPNSNQIVSKMKTNWYWALAIGAVFVASILSMGKVSEFLYFQF